MTPAAIARRYTALHEGLAPSSIRSVRTPKPTRVRIDLGRATAIEYDKKTLKGVEGFRHDFAPGAGPMLQHDETGRLHASGGRYHVTTHGIEDRPMSKNSIVRRGYSQPKRSNPGKSSAENYAAFAVEGVKIASTAVVLTLATDMVFRRTDFTYGYRAMIASAFGVISGLLVARWFPAIGIGLFAYGLTYGGRYAAASLNMQRFLANVVSGTREPLPAPASQPTAGTPPANPTGAGLPQPRAAQAMGAVRLAQPRMAA